MEQNKGRWLYNNSWFWILLVLMQTIVFSCKDKFLDLKTETRTVTFNTMGGSPIPSQSVFIGTTIRKPPIPTKELSFFAGWFQEEALTHAFSYSTLISNDITLYAKWRPAVVVKFETNGGNSIKNDTLPAGETVMTPINPSRTNSVFVGWFTDVSLTNEYNFPTTPVNENVTLYAKWIEGVTLTFQTSASVNVQSVGVMPGNVVDAPIDPIVADSTFAGWYVDQTFQNLFDFTQPIFKNTIVYAKWIQNIYNLQVYPATGNPQYYLVNGLKAEFSGTTRLYIPNNVGGIPVQRINTNAFLNNKTATEVYIEEGITHVLANAFDGCSNITTVRFPTTLVSIGNFGFRNCSSLSGDLQLPNSITGWGGSSFLGCVLLQRVTLPLNYGTLPSNTFSGCVSLKELFVPAMRKDAVTNEYIPVALANVQALSNTSPDLKIFVPAVLVDKYKAAANWSTYATRIQPMP